MATVASLVFESSMVQRPSRRCEASLTRRRTSLAGAPAPQEPVAGGRAAVDWRPKRGPDRLSREVKTLLNFARAAIL